MVRSSAARDVMVGVPASELATGENVGAVRAKLILQPLVGDRELDDLGRV
jgi:hypothetical protein